MQRLILILLGSALIILSASGATASEAASNTNPWDEIGPDGEPVVHLYFFWARNCNHCREALPFVEALGQQHSWLRQHSLEVTSDRSNARLYVDLARSIGKKARYVPAFLFCGTMQNGYYSADTTGTDLLRQLIDCRDRISAANMMTEPSRLALDQELKIPVLGKLDIQAMSLPALTLVLAGLDSFNPCAFFILLFLLSLLVHARSRSRMLVIGGIFVLFSGLIYFLFMAAWLNVFLLVGQLKWVTTVAALLAIGFAVVNIKDYFFFKHGISLTIPDGAKPGLFNRMRKLLQSSSLPAMVTATMVLAIVANSYELLCTAGFPMVYTRILTLNELNTFSYYLYLALYNAIYVIPLMIIVAIFAATLGARRMSEREGRILKLVSGLMMLGLGGLLLVAPAALNHLGVALLLLVGALVATFLVVKIRPPDDHC